MLSSTPTVSEAAKSFRSGELGSRLSGTSQDGALERVPLGPSLSLVDESEGGRGQGHLGEFYLSGPLHHHFCPAISEDHGGGQKGHLKGDKDTDPGAAVSITVWR